VVGLDLAGDLGLVAERVGALDGELADGFARAGRGGVERGREGARGVVEGVGDHALGEDPRREVVVREGLVGGRLRRGGASRRGRGGDGEEEDEAAVLELEHGGFGRRAVE